MKLVAQITVESHCQIRTKHVDMRQQLDSLKSSYEQRLMESEENLLTE